MTLSIKTGETLFWECADDRGDLSGVTIQAALRRGHFYKPLSVEMTDAQAGEYTVSADSTADFPTGALDCDLKYTEDGTVTHSETFKVYVSQGVTK